MTLTVKQIDAAQCEEGKRESFLQDEGKGGVEGLCLRITPQGRKAWRWRGYLNGKALNRSLGRYPYVSLAQAREKAEAYNAARAEGVDLDAQQEAEAKAEEAAAVIQAAEAGRTLQWLWDDLYCPRFIPDKTGNETARLIEKHLIPRLGKKRLADITFEELDDAVKALAKRAPKSADRFVVNVKTLFKRAKREFKRETGLTVNVAEDLIKPDGTINRRERWLSEDEIVYFYRAASRLKGVVKVHADCFDLILDTGCRLSEARLLKKEEIDFEEGVWTLPADRAKNKREHKMPLPKETLARLKARLTDSPYLFSSPRNKNEEYNSLSKNTAALLKKMREIAAKDGVEVEKWSAHTLRHTFVSHLRKYAASGTYPMITPDNIERAINHIEGGMKEWYNSFAYFEEKKAIYAFWQERLVSLRKRAVEDETQAIEQAAA